MNLKFLISFIFLNFNLGHSICIRCLDELCKQKNFNCPLCREKVYDYRPSYDILELLEESNQTKAENKFSLPKTSRVIDQVRRINEINRKDNFLINGPHFYLKSKKDGKYLNGSSNHAISIIQSTDQNTDWIKWRIKIISIKWIKCKNK